MEGSPKAARASRNKGSAVTRSAGFSRTIFPSGPTSVEDIDRLQVCLAMEDASHCADSALVQEFPAFGSKDHQIRS